MSKKGQAVLELFKELQVQEQQAVYEVITRSLAGDEGPLSDEDLTTIAAQNFGMVDDEVSRTRLPENQVQIRQLADQWYRDTAMLSMIHKKAMHPAYQQIIGMGKEALPFIFGELRRNKPHWFWALTAITREKVNVEEKGIPGTISAWLKWAEANGYA